MKILVLGANGFLGRHLVRKSLNRDWVIDCVYHKDKSYIPSMCRSFTLDELIEQNNNYDLIFLFASFIPYEKSDSINESLIDSNIVLPLKLIKKFPETKIIFSSSASVYGIHRTIISENSSFNNPNLYGLSKISAETILKLHSNYQIIRFSSIYGEGMNQNTFIPQIIQSATNDKKITVFGDGSRLQDYLYIDDAVAYCFKAAEQNTSGVYLGINGKSYSNKEVAKIIQELIPDCKIQYKDKDYNPSFIYENSLTKQLLQFTPSVNLEDGLRKVIKHD